MSQDPEPTLEYILESQWSERLVTLGFWPVQHPDEAKPEVTFLYRSGAWRIIASLCDTVLVTATTISIPPTTLFVHIKVYHDHESCADRFCPDYRVYRYADLLVQYLNSKPNIKNFALGHAGIMQEFQKQHYA